MHFDNMKHIVLTLTRPCVLLGILLSISATQLFAQDHPKGNTGEGAGLALPAFDFEAMDGSRVTLADMPADKPVIVFYFDPFCDHCQKEAGWINDNPQLFKDITLLWASWGDLKDIKEFPAKYLPNIKSTLFVTRDDKFEFDNYFGYSEIPSIYVYNKKHIRTATFREETIPLTLLRFALQ